MQFSVLGVIYFTYTDENLSMAYVDCIWLNILLWLLPSLNTNKFIFTFFKKWFYFNVTTCNTLRYSCEFEEKYCLIFTVYIFVFYILQFILYNGRTFLLKISANIIFSTYRLQSILFKANQHRLKTRESMG